MYKEWLKKSMTGKKLMKTGITLCMCAVFVNGALDTMVSAYDKVQNDVSEIVDSVQPSMVAVNTQPVAEVQKFYERYGFSFCSDTMDAIVEGSSSGVIVEKNKEELLIVTNYHRINESEVITITTPAGDSFQGELKGYDVQQDIAIVSVPITEVDTEAMEELNVATLGSYDDLKIGEQVITLGNALGYGQSATTGIVSAKGQRIETSECTCDNTLNLIQTDAAVHPGNTGGALVNMNGELIGIISTELNSFGFDGIGYAISVSDVTAMIESLTYEEDQEDTEYESHGSLGLEGVTVSDPYLKQHFSVCSVGYMTTFC